MAPKKVYARTACFIHEQHTNPPYSCLAHKSSVSRNWIFARTLNSTVATVCVFAEGQLHFPSLEMELDRKKHCQTFKV